MTKPMLTYFYLCTMYIWDEELCEQILGVLPSATRFGETGSGYPTNVNDDNRLSLLILRQNLALSDVSMMFIDLLDGCWYGDQNTLNTIPVSGQKITQSKWIVDYWIKNKNRKETNESRTTEITVTSNEYEKKHWFTGHRELKVELWPSSVCKG